MLIKKSFLSQDPEHCVFKWFA